jgi:hypothetical protein
MRLQIQSHADVVSAKSHLFIKRNVPFPAIQNHLVTSQPASLLEEIPDKRGADSLLLKVPVHGHVFNVATQSGAVNEFLLDQQGSRANDPIINTGDIASNSPAKSLAKNFLGLVGSQFHLG